MINEFKKYTRQVVKNAQVLSRKLAEASFDVISGGTEKHLVLIDLRNKLLHSKLVQYSERNSEKFVHSSASPVEQAPRYSRSLNKKTSGWFAAWALEKAGILQILNSLLPKKDVDGLRSNSPFVPAVKAILEIIDEAKSVLNLNLNSKLFVVFGSLTIYNRFVI